VVSEGYDTYETPTTVAMEGEVVLDVRDMSVSFPTDDGLVNAVRGISYQVRRGRSLGIVGESGAGKSVTSMAVMGLLPKTAQITGSATLLGEEILGLRDREISRIRGRNISMIFEDPLTSLNPVYTVGYQLIEAIRVHYPDTSKADARTRAVDLLATIGIPNPEQRVDQYPHELSGGMRQRVVIAIAMANNPDVIIADEPTTALDVTVQAQVMEALEKARDEVNAALVLITHDLGVVAGHTDDVLVMYAGRAVERGTVDQIFYEPRMPYTLGLLGSQPRMDEARSHRLTPVRGTPPSMLDLPPGCPFMPRCPLSRAECGETEPELVATEDSQGSGVPHLAACHFQHELVDVEPADIFPPVAQDLDILEDEGERP
jgi:oligopeptide/dipeptide ABC transporter ATP-binding protein